MVVSWAFPAVFKMSPIDPSSPPPFFFSVDHGSMFHYSFFSVAFLFYLEVKGLLAREASSLVFPSVTCLSRCPSVSPERPPAYSRRSMDMFSTKKLTGEQNSREFSENPPPPPPNHTPLVASVRPLTSDTLRGPRHTMVMTPRCLPAIFPSQSARFEPSPLSWMGCQSKH